MPSAGSVTVSTKPLVGPVHVGPARYLPSGARIDTRAVQQYPEPMFMLMLVLTR